MSSKAARNVASNEVVDDDGDSYSSFFCVTCLSRSRAQQRDEVQKTVANVSSLAEQVAQAEARADELAQQLALAKTNEEAAKQELSASEQTFAESLAAAETQVAQLQTQLDAKASTDSTVVQV